MRPFQQHIAILLLTSILLGTIGSQIHVIEHGAHYAKLHDTNPHAGHSHDEVAWENRFDQDSHCSVCAVVNTNALWEKKFQTPIRFVWDRKSTLTQAPFAYHFKANKGRAPPVK